MLMMFSAFGISDSYQFVNRNRRPKY